MRLRQSHSLDPFWNLAWEETWFRRPLAEPQLLFYGNRPSVWLGRNQNPWSECSPADLQRQEIPLLRRISGGGTVWHDPGNLNYAFVAPRLPCFSRSALLKEVAAALRPLGFLLQTDERLALRLPDGRKVGGTATAISSAATLFHGTLLLSADLPALLRHLQPGVSGLEGTASPSHPAEVANLGIDAGAVVSAFERHFGAVLDPEPGDLDPVFQEQRQSWEWIYGRTPDFVHDDNQGWRATVSQGRIVAATQGAVDRPEWRGQGYDRFLAVVSPGLK